MHTHVSCWWLLWTALTGTLVAPLQSSQGQQGSRQATGKTLQKWSLGRPHTYQRLQVGWTLEAHVPGEPPGV